MQSSLERIDPDHLTAHEITGNGTLQLHVARYHYAGRHLLKGTCADIACGTGYGSYLLATEYAALAQQIVSADIDPSAIERAKSRYQHPSIQFMQADAMQFQAPFPLNNIISLETIEHLPNPAGFIKNIAPQLVKGGRFISSVPITPSMDANPYHLHDFSRRGFSDLFTRAGFRMLDHFVQVQPYKLFSVMNKKEQRSKDLRKGMLSYYISHPSKFFLRLKSVVGDGFTNKYMVAVFEKL